MEAGTALLIVNLMKYNFKNLVTNEKNNYDLKNIKMRSYASSVGKDYTGRNTSTAASCKTTGKTHTELNEPATRVFTPAEKWHPGSLWNGSFLLTHKANLEAADEVMVDSKHQITSKLVHAIITCVLSKLR